MNNKKINKKKDFLLHNKDTKKIETIPYSVPN